MEKLKSIWEWIIKAYKSPANIPRMIYQAFLCEKKNGDSDKTFTTKKFYAFAFSSIALYNHVSLSFFTNHWTIKLTQSLKAVDLSDDSISTIIITLIGFSDALAFGALAVYGWAKRHGAL